jgi:hypothetical protein
MVELLSEEKFQYVVCFLLSNQQSLLLWLLSSLNAR